MKFIRTFFAVLIGTALAASAEPAKSPAEMMRVMRRAWLSAVPAKDSLKSPEEVTAVLMDWPLGETTATVLSSSAGDASLYTTSTFGIIGGIGHENVRKASIEFVAAAQRFLKDTVPTTDFPYPDSKTLRFYMVTAFGVRTISFPLKDTALEGAPARELFGYGQQVLTELRRIAPIAPK